MFLELKEASPGKSQGKSQSILSPTIPVFDGEDAISFHRHNSALKQEKKKVRPNKQVVAELMTQSFPMRWNDLHHNSYSVEIVFQMYPFLADVSEVYKFCASLLYNYIVNV